MTLLIHLFPTHMFYTPLKQKPQAFLMFQGVEKGFIGNKWVNWLVRMEETESLTFYINARNTNFRLGSLVLVVTNIFYFKITKLKENVFLN